MTRRTFHCPAALLVLLVTGGLACASAEPVPPAAAGAYDSGAVARTVLRLEAEMNDNVDALDCDAGLVAIGEGREPLFVSAGMIVESADELRQLCRTMVAGRTGAEFDDPVITVQVLSPDAAYVVRRGDYTVTRTDGSSRTAFLVMTTIWHRTPDGWRMVHLHESIRMPPAASEPG